MRISDWSSDVCSSDLPSGLGAFSYEVADTKLSRSPKPKHLIQMGVYADILTREQGTEPERMHVVLGDGTVATVGVSSIIHYFRIAQARFLEYVGPPPAESAGAPCGPCPFCRCAPFCAAGGGATGHIRLVAVMT